MGQRQDDMEVLAGLDLKVLGGTRESPSKPLLLVRAESRLHIEDERASPASCNITNLLWEAMLGLDCYENPSGVT